VTQARQLTQLLCGFFGSLFTFHFHYFNSFCHPPSPAVGFHRTGSLLLVVTPYTGFEFASIGFDDDDNRKGVSVGRAVFIVSGLEWGRRRCDCFHRSPLYCFGGIVRIRASRFHRLWKQHCGSFGSDVDLLFMSGMVVFSTGVVKLRNGQCAIFKVHDTVG
jgi:hypothetical protein